MKFYKNIELKEYEIHRHRCFGNTMKSIKTSIVTSIFADSQFL